MFFAGKSSIKVLDTFMGKICEGKVFTAISYISSIEVCEVRRSRVYLGVLGSFSDYSNKSSDLFDISELMGEKVGKLSFDNE